MQDECSAGQQTRHVASHLANCTAANQNKLLIIAVTFSEKYALRRRYILGAFVPQLKMLCRVLSLHCCCVITWKARSYECTFHSCYGSSVWGILKRMGDATSLTLGETTVPQLHPCLMMWSPLHFAHTFSFSGIHILCPRPKTNELHVHQES